MPSTAAPGPSVAEVLRNLAAARERLDGAASWFHRPEDAIRAAAMAEEVKRLCHQASNATEESEIGRLLGAANRCLEDLQRLLGTH
jgi:hypothetical protein